MEKLFYDLFDLKHLTPELRAQVENLLCQYESIFASHAYDLGQIQIATLDKLHDRLPNPSFSSESKLKQSLIVLFRDLSRRIRQALADFKLQRATLKELPTFDLDSSPFRVHDNYTSQAKAYEIKQDIVDHYGLASTGEVAVLFHWVAEHSCRVISRRSRRALRPRSPVALDYIF